MNNQKVCACALLLLTLLSVNCNNGDHQRAARPATAAGNDSCVPLPRPANWIKDPVRNRLVVLLNRSTTEVWSLIGDPVNMPKYSSGLDSVTKKTVNGLCIQYTCYFKPLNPNEAGYVHTENMLWQKENCGWASRMPEPNESGCTGYLSLLTLEKVGEKTKMTWAMTCNHENAEMIRMIKEGLFQAFRGIGQQLVKIFGGSVVENYREK
ncbi:MAG: SRPBCC family protein [Sphingobacteriales bacterium]|nr:SRPBCC family protein [Sphingobacteriales bacterium]